MSSFQLLTQLAPDRDVSRAQLLCRPVSHWRRHRCHHAHWRPHHQATRWPLVPCRPPLMVPRFPKILL
jgi:hypothetical protein